MYHKYFSTRNTPQTEAIPGKNMIKNRAGGFVFQIDDWKRLERWLILGSSEPIYYASAKELTIENAEVIARCMKVDGMEVVSRIVEVSESGRAPRNNPALFALAMCAGMGDAKTRTAALDALPRVARTGTHLFTVLTYVEAFRGWGRGLKNSVARWYDNKSLDQLSYQIAKYRQRGGWTHRDVLRLSHPKTNDFLRNEVYKWIVGKTNASGFVDTEAQLLYDFERLQQAESEKSVIGILNSNRSLSWEMIPTEYLGSPKVWEALLPNLPMTATIRNLARMTKNGLLAPMSNAAKLVCEKITNPEHLRRARIHPFSVLKALVAYGGRRACWTSGNWPYYTTDIPEKDYQPVTWVLDALDETFYLTFDNIKPYSKRTMLALDISGSMEFNFLTDGRKGTEISARVASAAMAMVTARREPEHMFLGFFTQAYPLTISPRQRLDDVVKYLNAQRSGGTDCALPIQWATKNKVPIDVFVLFTDGETWAGNNGHPSQAIIEYRQKMGIAAKMVVVGMTATGTTITDPMDAGSMSVVGFDASAPNIISQFVAS